MLKSQQLKAAKQINIFDFDFMMKIINCILPALIISLF